MDILACVVGATLLLVVYTVLELGSTSYPARLPALREPPEESRVVVVVAHEETVRVMDANRALDGLLTGIDIVRSQDLTTFVAQANRRPANDAFFSYSLARRDGFVSSGDAVEGLDLRIEARSDAVGDSLHQLGPGSAFAASLGALDPSLARLVFAVDTVSVDVFRAARQAATERGFAVDWRPSFLEFPLTYGLTGRDVDDAILARASGTKAP